MTQADPDGFGGVIFNGFVANEDQSVDGVFQGQGQVVRTNAGIQAAGTYVDALVPSGWEAKNYDISYETGDFTIVPADTLLVRATSQQLVYADTVGQLPTTTAQYLDSQDNQIKSLQIEVAPETGRLFVNDSIGGLAAFDLTPTNASLSNAGFVRAGGYDLTASAIEILQARHFKDMVAVGSLTINPRVIDNSTAVSTVQKIYDGNRAIKSLPLQINVDQAGVMLGDQVTVIGSGAFDDRHVGQQKAVKIDVVLRGEDATNYRLSQNSLQENIGSIVQLDSVQWTGDVNDLWSNSANWQGGALPDRNNVAKVIIGEAARADMIETGNDADAQSSVSSINLTTPNSGELLQRLQSNYSLSNERQADRLWLNGHDGEPLLIRAEVDVGDILLLSCEEREQAAPVTLEC